MQGELSTKRAIILSLAVGVIFSFVGIIVYLVGANEYEYKSGITVTKSIGSLSVLTLALNNIKYLEVIDDYLFTSIREYSSGGQRIKGGNDIFQVVRVIAFVVVPVIFCVTVGWLIVRFRRYFSPKKNISEVWFVVILIVSYPAANIITYLIFTPVSRI